MVEKYTELELIAKHAQKVGVRPRIGVRVKLASRGSGRWKSSGGYRSKFGLTVTEALKAVDFLKERGMEDCLELLHFHLGSQITNIRQIKAAVIEGARVYVDFKRLGTGLKYMDVGGGLGIDYDGSQTDFESSVNYTLEEYARDVVYHIQSICDEAEVPHPTIITESGRAVAAYHSALVFNVLGISGFGEEELPDSVPEESEQCLIDLFETYRSITKKNLLETYHDAQQALDSALNLFSLGYLPLDPAQPCRELLLGDLPQDPEIRKGAGLFPGGVGRSGRHVVGYLFLQLLAFPEHARQLGRETVVSHHAHPPPERTADAPCCVSATFRAIRMAKSISSSIAGM